jgi:NitT/TauT family transport system ATP-binding protein
VAEDRVRVEDLGRDIDGRAIVADCSFTLADGAVTAMVGPSGCGKTTIAYMLAGYDEPTTGRVVAEGQRLLVFQEPALMPWLTTYDNITFGRRDSQRAEELLERTGLADARDRHPSELSGGMQRRAELARALINEPALLILDEPFRGLDALTRRQMHDYVAELLRDRPRTTLLITTDIDEAIRLADRLLVMTNRPTRVRETLAARPENKARALELLHEEALRSFETRPGAPV